MTTDVVEKCAIAASLADNSHNGEPFAQNYRNIALAVIDALADGVSDETLAPMARAIHDRTWEDDPFDGLPKDGAERGLAIEIARAGIRALSAAIRAAKSRETA